MKTPEKILAFLGVAAAGAATALLILYLIADHFLKQIAP